MKISLNIRIQDLEGPRLNYDDRGDKQGLDPCVYFLPRYSFQN